MNWILFVFLSFPFFSYFCFQFIPSGNVLLFYFSFIFYLLLSFGTYWTIFRPTIISHKKYKFFITKDVIVVHVIFIVLLLFSVLYHDFYRWQIEPNGMLDSILIWNVKAKLIGETFLNSKPVYFHDPYWKFDSYPIGLPLTLAFFTVLNGGWALNIAYAYAISLLLLCIALFISFISQLEATLKQVIFSWILFLSFILEFNVLMNHSSIVADFPIFVGVFCLAYLYFSKWTMWSTFIFALNLGWVLFTKNEGIFYVLVGMFLYGLKLKTSQDIIQNKKVHVIQFVLFLTLFLFPSILHKFQSEFVPSDFQRKEALAWSFELFSDKLKWILSYAFQFHFQFLLGIHLLILFSYARFFERNLEKYSLNFLLLSLPLIYMLLYFFSNYDHSEAAKFLGEAYKKMNLHEKEIFHLKEHLESSFYRINTHYLPLFLFIGLQVIQKFFSKNN